MLHSSLPRAFLTPELNYLSYYSDEVHQHSYTVIPSTTWQISMQSPSSSSYSRIPEHRLTLQSNWDSSRSSTPCPLDLSLKPPPTPNTPKTEEIIEVNDERDERVSEDDERRSENEMYGMLLLDDSSIHDRRSYEQLLSKKEFVESQSSPEKIRIFEDAARLVSHGSNNDIPSKYHAQNQKVLLTSPSSLQSVHGYHQQLLLTPQQHYLQGMQHAPMTPPSTPSPPQCPRRRVREEEGSPVAIIAGSGVSSNAARQTDSTSDKALQRPKKKHARRLKFDEDTSSPVSGTVILGPDEAVVTGDIDPAFNIVEVTEEARAELAKIENRLGPYQCKLCRQLHEDAFQLAQHRCSRIAHVEYRCPECDKRFSCPANLASHRRWHKPRLLSTGENPSASSIEIPCTRCEAKFTRQAALRKHLATQHPEVNNNTYVGSSGNTSNTNTASMNNNDNRVLLEAQETIGKADTAHLSAIDNGPSTEMP